MAVAAGEAQATVTEKILLSRGRSMYIGTFAFGTEYATGGDTIGTAETSRYKLPERLDFMAAQTGFLSELVKGSPNKIKLSATKKEGEADSEVASKTNLSAITAAPFMAVGVS
jgi:hypothetical protein